MEKLWYVVNTYSGHESKVKEKLEAKIESMGMEDYIYRVVIPETTEVEVKDGVKKQILDENEDALMDIAHKEAKVRNVGIKSAAKAVKEGLKEEDTIYCKHCGYEIDSDSKFCKKCGKEQ